MTPSAAAVAETHTAVVFFLGDRAYKVKKQVDLGFLDFRPLSVRREVCHREVELNRRLAPDVYLGVSDVTDTEGVVCDHLVVMRRMPPDRRLSTLVEAGHDVSGAVREVARLLAAFHERAERGPAADQAAGIDATRSRWSTNTAELAPFAGRHVEQAKVHTVQRLADRYLDGRRALFELRIREGRACDGHGDLLADDVFCLDDGPRILDCIEFDDVLRLGDALADVAFLAMDLERLGATDMAEQFLDAYREHTADTWPPSLAHHHIAYRAQVRAKVAAIRADQGDADSARRAGELLDLALDHLERGRVRCVVVGGLPGTGKSTLARGLAERLDATVLRSDEVRVELDGAARSDGAAGFQQGRYSPEATTATYEEMFRRAGVALSLGESVVVDASFVDAGHRAAARGIAEGHHADLVELRCTAPDDVTAERMRRRAERGDDPSEATPEIARSLASVMDPWPEAHELDTDRTVHETLRTAERLVHEN